jgi:hypothetical protein
VVSVLEGAIRLEKERVGGRAGEGPGESMEAREECEVGGSSCGNGKGIGFRLKEWR